VLKKWLIMTVGLVSVLAMLGLAGCSQGAPVLSATPSTIKVNLGGQQEGIWVSGSGKVAVVPDIAQLRLGIEAQEASVAEAQSRAAQAMEAVMAALENGGVAAKDIKTSYFNIQRVTRWDEGKGQEVVIGYRVSNMVTVKMREMDALGALIDAAVSAGGDLIRIDSISFSVEDPSAYYKEAREKAMADARAKAEQLAELAGVTLGKPTYISESTYTSFPTYREEFLAKAAGAPVTQTPISPGEMEISLGVQVTYAIAD